MRRLLLLLLLLGPAASASAQDACAEMGPHRACGGVGAQVPPSWPMSGGPVVSWMSGASGRGALLVGAGVDAVPVLARRGAADAFGAVRLSAGVGLGWGGGVRPVGAVDGGAYVGIGVQPRSGVRLAVRAGAGGHASPAGQTAGPMLEASAQVLFLQAEVGRTLGVEALGTRGATRVGARAMLPVPAPPTLVWFGGGLHATRLDGLGRTLWGASVVLAF